MESEVYRALAALAARNHGVFSRAQAHSRGVTRRQIDRLLASGQWERMGSGVYRVAGTPDHPRTPLAVAVLGSGGYASHRSAAELLGLRDTLPRVPEIVIAGDRRYVGAAVSHRTDTLAREDRTRVAGIRSTSVVRTLFDLGGVLTDSEFEGVVHRALSARRINAERLDARLVALAARGRPGSMALRAVLQQLDVEGRPTESQVEVRVLQVLRRAGVRLPQRQVPVAVGGRDYRLDFAYRAEKVLLEGDGFGVHAQRDTFESDRVRQNALVIAGWLPLRYTDRMLRRTPTRVADEVRTILAARAISGDLTTV